MEFTREWEALEDPTIYEWMKHKLAADIGDHREVEALAEFEKQLEFKKGEHAYGMWKADVDQNSIAQKYIC